LLDPVHTLELEVHREAGMKGIIIYALNLLKDSLEMNQKDAGLHVRDAITIIEEVLRKC